jgi:hypothetical protein
MPAVGSLSGEVELWNEVEPKYPRWAKDGRAV